ncbi:MAG: hypothetical protein ACREFC_00595 [Stellaceae bacterium]
MDEERAYVREAFGDDGAAEIIDLMEAAGGIRFTLRSIAELKRRYDARLRKGQNETNPQIPREHRERWREANPKKVCERNHRRDQKRRNDNYFRPIIAIDSEGRNYPGEDDRYIEEISGRVLYEKHETNIWGAAADDGPEPDWPAAQCYVPGEKRPLTVYEILDWLLTLPDVFGNAAYVSFAFGYDVTQILKSLPYDVVWQICKRESYSLDPKARRPIGSSPVYWGEYAFS